MAPPGNHPDSERIVAELLQQITELNRQLPCEEPRPDSTAIQTVPGDAGNPEQLEHALAALGLLPEYAAEIVAHLRTNGAPLAAPAAALQSAGQLLRQCWQQAPRPTGGESHVFVGPAGAGKTTVLSKWLAQVVLLGGRSAWVWRLDGRTANAAEALTVYGEILGVPVARAWNGESQPVDAQFFDLPAVDWRDAVAMTELRDKILGLRAQQVHLVLNAAYETPLLLEQVRAFSSWPVTDLIFTHLDEERRWGKLWNFVLGTVHPIRLLSAGQDVPGHLREATADLLLPGTNP